MIDRELDIKILILYILSKLPGKVVFESLFDAVNENGVGYFDFAQCFSDLVENGNISQDEDGIYITAQGKRNAEAVVSELPNSVRRKTDKHIAVLSEHIRRMQLVKAVTETEDGSTYVRLSLEDGQGELINLKVLVADEKQAAALKKNFKRSAEDYYKKIVELLS